MEQRDGIHFLNLQEFENARSTGQMKEVGDTHYISKYGLLGLGSSREALERKIASTARTKGAKAVYICDVHNFIYKPLVTQRFAPTILLRTSPS
ncbi:hypothetical protein CMI48_01810 [Candidatus Pacearchaeota archaeon]|nr:hypothetical protein [Candidatus Pacearchaeota archaeon]|tara:strand:- start:514 stop:795 length:282 start_codon:yes stop_codon:yes gene_type:complete